MIASISRLLLVFKYLCNYKDGSIVLRPTILRRLTLSLNTLHRFSVNFRKAKQKIGNGGNSHTCGKKQ